MSDIGETFAALKEANKEKKANNLSSSLSLLDDNNISYELKNGGVHAICESAKGKIDFWPSTGKYIVRSTGKPGRGVFNLLKYIQRINGEKQ